MSFIFTSLSETNDSKDYVMSNCAYTIYQEYKEMCMALEEAGYRARERVRVEKEKYLSGD